MKFKNKDTKKKIRVKEEKYDSSQDEKMFAALSYIFPFQFFVWIMAVFAGINTDFVKHHLKKSFLVYIIFILLNVPVPFLLNVTGTLFRPTRILLFIMFLISIAIVFYIIYCAMKIFKED